MGKIAGVDVLLKIKNNEGKLVVVGGQTDTTLNRERETIDTTDKTSGGWSSSIPGIASWSFDSGGFVVLGDPEESFDLMEDAFYEKKEVYVDIRVGEKSSEHGRNYKGSGYIVDFPLEFPKDDAVTFSISISGNSKLEKVKGVDNGDGGTNPNPEPEPEPEPTDTTGPVIQEVNRTYNPELNTLDIEFNVTDYGSGIHQVSNHNDYDTYFNPGVTSHNLTLTHTSNGSHLLTATDNSLYFTDFYYEVTEITEVVDPTVPPNIEITNGYYGGTEANTSYTVDYTASIGSGGSTLEKVVLFKFVTDTEVGIELLEGGTTTFRGSFSVTENGNYSIFVHDSLGNTGSLPFEVTGIVVA